jgi:hypothetical protein
MPVAMRAVEEEDVDEFAKVSSSRRKSAQASRKVGKGLPRQRWRPMLANLG